MTPDQRRRLQLAGAAAARELLAWSASTTVGPDAPRELLAIGEAVGSAALRAVLGAAREPTAAAWYVELAIVPVAPDGRGPVLGADLVVDLEPEQLDDVALAELRAELLAGFRDAAAPVYAAAVERERAGGRR